MSPSTSSNNDETSKSISGTASHSSQNKQSDKEENTTDETCVTGVKSKGKKTLKRPRVDIGNFLLSLSSMSRNEATGCSNKDDVEKETSDSTSWGSIAREYGESIFAEQQPSRFSNFDPRISVLSDSDSETKGEEQSKEENKRKILVEVENNKRIELPIPSKNDNTDPTKQGRKHQKTEKSLEVSESFRDNDFIMVRTIIPESRRDEQKPITGKGAMSDVKAKDLLESMIQTLHGSKKRQEKSRRMRLDFQNGLDIDSTETRDKEAAKDSEYEMMMSYFFQDSKKDVDQSIHALQVMLSDPLMETGKIFQHHKNDKRSNVTRLDKYQEEVSDRLYVTRNSEAPRFESLQSTPVTILKDVSSQQSLVGGGMSGMSANEDVWFSNNACLKSVVPLVSAISGLAGAVVTMIMQKRDSNCGNSDLAVRLGSTCHIADGVITGRTVSSPPRITRDELNMMIQSNAADLSADQNNSQKLVLMALFSIGIFAAATVVKQRREEARKRRRLYSLMGIVFTLSTIGLGTAANNGRFGPSGKAAFQAFCSNSIEFCSFVNHIVSQLVGVHDINETDKSQVSEGLFHTNSFVVKHPPVLCDSGDCNISNNGVQFSLFLWLWMVLAFCTIVYFKSRTASLVALRKLIEERDAEDRAENKEDDWYT